MLCERAAAVNTQFVSFEPNDLGAGATDTCPNPFCGGADSHAKYNSARTQRHVRGHYSWPRYSGNRGPRESSTCYCGAGGSPWVSCCAKRGEISYHRKVGAMSSAAATSRASSAKVLGCYRDALRQRQRERPDKLDTLDATRSVPAAAQASLAHLGSARRDSAAAHSYVEKFVPVSWPAFKNEAASIPQVGQAVYSGETTALALRVLRATAQYSICGWAFYFKPFYHYVPVSTQSLKAVEAKPGQAERIEKGSGVF